MTEERAKELLAYAGLEGEKTKVYYMILSRMKSDCDYYLNYQRGMKGGNKRYVYEIPRHPNTSNGSYLDYTTRETRMADD